MLGAFKKIIHDDQKIYSRKIYFIQIISYLIKQFVSLHL